MAMNPKRVLMVYYNRDDACNTRLTINQHVRTLDASDSKHDVVYYNAFKDYPSLELGEKPLAAPPWAHSADFDSIILHYSFLAFHWHEQALIRWKRLFSWIGEMDCLKVAIPQDEYDRAGLLDEWLYEWGVNVVFSCFDEDKRGPLYPCTRSIARLVPCLTGYIDEQAAHEWEKRLQPSSERPFDIVYRARRLPFWFGSAGQLKHRLAEIVESRAETMGLECDISTRDEDVILDSRWLDFMASSRAVIGCESGVGVVDWRGEIEARVRAILKGEPTLSFEGLNARMPVGWDSYRFFAISPRHFEAIITKTCQILVEGEYSGILEPNKHYIPLKCDFSNLDETLEKVRDDSLVEEMVERAYNDIYLSGRYSYRSFAYQIEEVLFGGRAKNENGKVIRIERDAKRDTTMEKALQGLERQLIVERHQNALLEAKLLEARQQIGELNNQVQAQTRQVQDQMRVFAEEVRRDMEALGARLELNKKEVMLLFVLVAFCGSLVSSCLTLLVLRLLGLS